MMKLNAKWAAALLCALATLLSPVETANVRADALKDLQDSFAAQTQPDGTQGKDSRGNAYRWISGTLFYDQGGYAEQIEHLTAAIKADPAKASLYVDRGRAYQQVFEKTSFGGSVAHDYFAADKDFDKAIALDPTLAQAWEERALNIQSPMLNSDKNSILRSFADGLSDANQAIKLQPDKAAYYTGRGSLYLRAINEEVNIIHSSTTPQQIEDAARSAEADFSKALMLDPTTPDASRDRALARIKLKALPSLINADIAQAVAVDPKDVQAQGMRVDSALAAGDWATARQAADAILALRPEAVPVYLARARARFNLKDPEGAIADASHAVDQSGADQILLSQALQMRGQIYAAQGKSELALSDFLKATTAYAYSAEAWDNLGNTQASAGKLEDAISTYHQALEKLPTAYLFHLRLALLAAFGDDIATIKKEYAAALPQVTADDLHGQADIVEALLKSRPNSAGLLAAREALRGAVQPAPALTSADVKKLP